MAPVPGRVYLFLNLVDEVIEFNILSNVKLAIVYLFESFSMI